MNQVRNIIVTGSNKGIGYGIVNYLAKSANWNIIMACRNVELANKAREEILAKNPGSKVHVEQLDVSDPKNIEAFIQLIKQKYQHIDVLVNNAGVAVQGDEVFNLDVFNVTFATNYYGTIELSEKILPLLSENGKIVTVGSTYGRWKFNEIKNEEIKNRFTNPNITKEELNQLVSEFKDDIAVNQAQEKGWPKSAYGISKLAINIYSTILSRYQEVKSKGIQVYVCCPGYVATDLNNHKGNLTIEEGARTPVYLVELPFEVNKELQGQFFQNEKLSSTFKEVL